MDDTVESPLFVGTNVHVHESEFFIKIDWAIYEKLPAQNCVRKKRTRHDIVASKEEDFRPILELEIHVRPQMILLFDSYTWFENRSKGSSF